MDRHNLPTQKLSPTPAQEEPEDVERIEDSKSDSPQMDIEENDAPIPSPKVNIDIDKSYNTGGITIEFPYKPYQSQKEMMKSIISGVNHGRHCLLESPTGTGKTAALLCALRAWQIACKADLNRLHPARDTKLKELELDPKCTCGFIPSNTNKDNIKIKSVPSGRFFKEIYNLWIRVYSENVNDKESEELKGSPNKMPKIDPISEELRGVEKLCPYCIHTHLVDKTRPPRIYYGTRTHSQITQIVKELKNSPYSENIKISVLASRKNYCVNSELTRDPNSIDDKCAKLRKNYFANKKNENQIGKEKEEPLPTCSHFERYQMVNNTFGSQNISTRFSDKVRDIEDLKNDCESKCPYYISRSLHEDAEIIFLPYNYLIQPSIRRFTGVGLAGSIVVFDEAHNIESACMEAASKQVNLSKLNFETRRELDAAIQFMPTLELEEGNNNNIWHLRLMPQKLGQISTFLRSFSTWLAEKDKKLFPFIHKPGNQSTSNPKSKEIKMEEMLQEWRDAMMSEEEVNKILFSLQIILHENNEFISSFSSHYAKHITANPNNSTPQFNFKKLLKSIDHFFCTINFLYAKKSKNLDDFVATLEHICKKGDSTQKKCNPDIIFKLNCLNPGLAFAILKNACHSVIVTSGTLSPMANFSHELETKFGEILSANHAIPEKNVLASFLSKYSMHSINWNSYGQKWSTNFDILGEAILQIAEVVPKGVLVFVASYGFLEKLKNQWETVPEQNFNNIPIPLQLRLNIVKKVFWEIRDGHLNAKNVETYKSLIKDGGGAIYFGVFRGKISEGVDFKGDHARAVISIGIPYQCIGPEVEAKKKYVNDKKIPGYTGQVWYDTEAYRAINQALGRCIRDTSDWGALILLDLRFAELFQSRLPDPFNGRFSRWIKPKYKLNLQTLIESLQEFVLEMQQ